MKVLCIGEHALRDAASIQAIAALLPRGRGPAVLVVPAPAGVRLLLEEAAREAEAGSAAWQERVNGLRERLLGDLRRLFPPREQAAVITAVQLQLNDLEDILHGVQLLRECSPRTLELVSSFAVRLACTLVARYLQRQGHAVHEVPQPGVVLQAGDSALPKIDYPATFAALRRELRDPRAVAVVAGGLALTPAGATALLGRDGADHTATLIAAALQAETVELWTDSPGVMSADPACVPEAFVVPALSYQEAMELSYFGARMVHARALVPAMEAEIPIRVAQLTAPDRPGTTIRLHPERTPAAIVGIASIGPAALVNIEGGGMVGVPGIAARIFGALARASVNVIMISQASSEHSICVVFREPEAERALGALQKELAAEIAARQIQNFDLRRELAILAVIGDNMRGTPGISGRLFSSLGAAGINILAIAQGSSETNISFLVDKRSEAAALLAVHRAFLGAAEAQRPGGGGAG